MKLSGMAEELERQESDPNHDLIPFQDRLGNIINSERNTWYSKKLMRFIKKADLRYPQADLDETISDPERQLDVEIIEQLSTCQWIEEARKSILVISQLPVKSWFDLFKDNTYADACLDRLICKAYRLEFNGKNMRNPQL